MAGGARRCRCATLHIPRRPFVMKFGKHLVTVVEEVHPDWSAAFLSYKSLKKILGRLESEGVQSLTAEEMHALEEEFCKVLVGEVNKMDKFFVDKVRGARRRRRGLHRRWAGSPCAALHGLVRAAAAQPCARERCAGHWIADRLPSRRRWRACVGVGAL